MWMSQLTVPRLLESLPSAVLASTLMTVTGELLLFYHTAPPCGHLHEWSLQHQFAYDAI